MKLNDTISNAASMKIYKSVQKSLVSNGYHENQCPFPMDALSEGFKCVENGIHFVFFAINCSKVNSKFPKLINLFIHHRLKIRNLDGDSKYINSIDYE